MKPIRPDKEGGEREHGVIGPRRRRTAAGPTLPRVSWSDLSGRSWVRGAGLGVVGLLLGYLVATQLLFPAPARPADLVEMPDLAGESLPDALARLDGLGLVVTAVDSIKHPTFADGGVFGQSPLPGQRAMPGTEVRLTVSAGRQEVRVPALAGAPLDQARALLEASGFTLEVDSVESSASRGSVVALAPEAGALVELPAQVLVSVSLGPPLVAVPRLVGMSEEEARAALEALGLRISDVEVRFRFGLDQGKVIEQEPAPGREVEEGSAVRLVVGRRAREGGS
ncbi:MAG: PASTA domain-containing protein [Gemmatimonadota bacterium]